MGTVLKVKLHLSLLYELLGRDRCTFTFRTVPDRNWDRSAFTARTVPEKEILDEGWALFLVL